MDIRQHNRAAWNRFVQNGNRWTKPVTPETIARARNTDFDILLTPTTPVPMAWFPILSQSRTLCLASGGGQQGPVLAAAGAKVTVLDNSPQQLEQDRSVAERENLSIDLVEGDMADLSIFSNNTFDLIVHPCSNCFVPNVIPVWNECYRVLRNHGILMAGFTNPVRYIFDDERQENGNLEVRYSLPYSDTENLDKTDLQRFVDAVQPLEIGHTLDDQIGGQLKAGLLLTDFFEDTYGESEKDPISRYMSTFIATRAIKQQ